MGKDLECIMSAGLDRVRDVAMDVAMATPASDLIPCWEAKGGDNAKKETSAEFSDIVKWNALAVQEFSYFMQIFLVKANSSGFFFFISATSEEPG